MYANSKAFTELRSSLRLSRRSQQLLLLRFPVMAFPRTFQVGLVAVMYSSPVRTSSSCCGLNLRPRGSSANLSLSLSFLYPSRVWVIKMWTQVRL